MRLTPDFFGSTSSRRKSSLQIITSTHFVKSDNELAVTIGRVSVLSMLDNCNSLLVGSPFGSLDWLQRTQNQPTVIAVKRQNMHML